jgi:hypothetical protein
MLALQEEALPLTNDMRVAQFVPPLVTKKVYQHSYI